MLEQDLKSTIESVYERMKKLKDWGKGPCEMQVRYSLVDPILRSIGWSLENPDCVRVEGSEDNKRRDYTLFVNKKKVAAIETKAYGNWSPCFNESSRKSKEYKQINRYCIETGIKIMIITDGGYWDIFSLHDNRKVKTEYTLNYDYIAEKLTREQNIKKMIDVFSMLTPRKIANLP